MTLSSQRRNNVDSALPAEPLGASALPPGQGPRVIEVCEHPSDLDLRLRALANCPAVFLVWPTEGMPYLGRTNVLRRRLLRLLGERAQPSRLLNLRSVAARVEYWRTASGLEASLVQYALARLHFPDTYLELLKLRMPPYVKVLLANEFPRAQVTTRLGGSRGFAYGPFRSRAAAEQFEAQFLDLFQIRRCQEDLVPSPQHPGCIYGEMNMCLRPCQQVVGMEEYGSEVERVLEFLATNGRSLVEAIEKARDRLSEELNFEEAARQHKRMEKVQQVLKLRDDLVRDIDSLYGVAIVPSAETGAVALWFVAGGCWQEPRTLTFEIEEGKPVSLDHKLHDIVAGIEPRRHSTAERQEHAALLARWYYSSWRQGEWVQFDTLADVPYRKLVNAIHRVAKGTEG